MPYQHLYPRVLVSLLLVLFGLTKWARPFAQPFLNLPRGETRSALPTREAPKADIQTQVRVAEAYGQLPLSFEVNKGQTDPRVKFLSRGSGYSLFLTASESVLVLNGPPEKSVLSSREPQN